ncbi:hypothetical protein F5Y12DRAFT_109952 [Xylaria sp. FL1777]|nr:hypothetical protein F5Y12DRAFT_109952 [Xylaria sp. FL1777]
MATSSTQGNTLVTIIESFNYPLPSIQNGNSIDEDPDTHLSGSKAAQTDPPVFCAPLEKECWVKLGHKTLQSIRLPTEYLSLPEKAMVHMSEADVIRSAAIYLLHPINQVLYTISPSTTCLAERASKNVRSDICFIRGGTQGRIFALVEFKRRGVIRPNEFRRASRQLTQDPNTQRAQINQCVQAAMNEDQKTFFTGNSFKLIKQAAAYAIDSGTRYVALFNWDYLVLIHFGGINPGLVVEVLEAQGVGPYCDITMIPNSPRSADIRPALLGFLVRAYQDTP